MHEQHRRDILIYWLLVVLILFVLFFFKAFRVFESMKIFELVIIVLFLHTFFYITFIRRHVHALEKRQAELHNLFEVVGFEISAITMTTQQTGELMKKTLELVFKALKADACSIMLVDEAEGALTSVAGRGPHLFPDGFRMKVGEGIAGWVAKEGRGISVPDVLKEPLFIPSRYDFGIRSLVCVPLKIGDRVFGVINVSRFRNIPFSDEEEKLLNVIASRAALALQNTDILGRFEEEKKMLDKILNTASDAIICLDGSKKVLFMNHKGEALTGWKINEVVGRSFCREAVQWRDMRGHMVCNFDCPLERACKSGEKTAVSEGILITKNGSQLWVEHQYSALTDEEGRLTFAVLIVRDISNRKNAERLRLQLTSNIVHELKTPLTYIRGYVDLLLMGRMGKLADEQQKSLEVVRDSVFRILSLIDNLLEVARIEEGKFYLSFKPIAFDQLIVKAVNLAKAEAVRKNIDLQAKLPDSFPEVYADGKRLEEVLMNLLSNALKYTNAGGKVEVGLEILHDMIHFYVADTGVGIAPENMGNIFSRFAQLDQPGGERPGEGAGLGLNIVKRVVEAHGGQLEVESELGKGTTFHVKIPKRVLN
jgi:PAS domain S-box-containing protein